MTATPYPEYEDSAIKWVGATPSHWRVAPLKTVATCNDECLSEDTAPEREIEYVEIGDVDEAKGILETQRMYFADAPSRARRLPRHGDILVSTVRTYLRAITPVRQVFGELVASTGFAVVRPLPDRLSSAFAGYMLRAEWLISEIISRSVGVNYPAIRSEEIMSLRIPVPPLREQKAIAGFLDHETARIDALIEKQQRLMELLQEKRNALVSHAVTKGIGGDTPTVDSRTEWLGDIPKHWSVGKLGFWLSSFPCYGVLKPDYYTGSDGVPLIRIKDLMRGGVDTDDLMQISPKLDLEYHRSRVEIGNVLLSVVGTLDKSLVVGPNEVGSNLSRAIARIQVGKGIKPRFLALFFESEAFRQFVSLTTKGTAQKVLNMVDLYDLKIGMPSIEEQADIVEYVDSHSAPLDDLLQDASDAIGLQKERRSALISAAVTGKIDVRDWSEWTSSYEQTQPCAADEKSTYG